MKRLCLGLSIAFLFTICVATPYLLDGLSREILASSTSGPAMVKASAAMLAALDAGQRKQATFAYDDAERFKWHFVPKWGPNGTILRKGLPLKAMNSTQVAAIQTLLKAGLSEVGVKKVNQVRELEGILFVIEGGKKLRRPDLYYLSIFGSPGKGGWGWRFEGHHLCLNFTLRDAKVISTTPFFLGANPAIVKEGPHRGLRTLPDIEDHARELVASLSAELLKIAVGKGDPMEVEGMEQSSYSGPFPAGVTADRLNAQQKASLDKLILAFVRNYRDDLSSPMLAETRRSPAAKVTIAWRGSLEQGKPHSYIVHSPDFVISYANFQNGANHIHAAYRDRTGEFGVD